MDSSLVAGTCIGISSASNEQDEYGLCILDEASKASFAEALVPLVRADRWILVGDRRQLPPFADSALRDRKALEQHEIDRDLVGETLLDRLDRLKLPATCRSMLTRQHRMVPAIGDLVSTVFYDGQLNSIGGQDVPKAIAQAQSKPVMWYSTSRDAQRFEQPSRSSWINMLEVTWVKNILDRLNFWARAVAGARTDKTVLIHVAVLTGYSAQRWQLDAALAADRREFLDVEVHSIDSYQGREADFVVLSVTRSNRIHQPGFLKDRERINVALSRAKFGLCLVGDADFCHHVASGSPLSEVLSYIRTHPETCALADGIK
jgi:superfamily I DNA and/or RNA helicase